MNAGPLIEWEDHPRDDNGTVLPYPLPPPLPPEAFPPRPSPSNPEVDAFPDSMRVSFSVGGLVRKASKGSRTLSPYTPVPSDVEYVFQPTLWSLDTRTYDPQDPDLWAPTTTPGASVCGCGCFEAPLSEDELWGWLPSERTEDIEDLSCRFSVTSSTTPLSIERSRALGSYVEFRDRVVGSYVELMDVWP